MPTIGKIKAELHGDTRNFDQAMRRSGRRVSGFKQKLQQLRSVILPLTGALGFGSLIRSTVAEASQMGDLSKRLGVSTDSFSRLARVLNRSGIGMSQTATMLQRLQRRAADAQDGNKGLSAAFKQLGINVDRFVKLDPVEAFLQVGKALARVSPQAERIQLAFKLLDSEGVAALQANLPKLREEMQKTSAISDEQAAKIKKLEDAWTALGESMRTAVAGSFSALSPGAEQPTAQGKLMTQGLKQALDPFKTVRQRLVDWAKGALGMAGPGFELQAPRTGRIQGTGAPHSIRMGRGVAGADAMAGQLHGGSLGELGPSNAILEQLRAIKRNTEVRGAVLE